MREGMTRRAAIGMFKAPGATSACDPGAWDAQPCPGCLPRPAPVCDRRRSRARRDPRLLSRRNSRGVQGPVVARAPQGSPRRGRPAAAGATRLGRTRASGRPVAAILDALCADIYPIHSANDRFASLFAFRRPPGLPGRRCRGPPWLSVKQPPPIPAAVRLPFLRCRGAHADRRRARSPMRRRDAPPGPSSERARRRASPVHAQLHWYHSPHTSRPSPLRTAAPPYTCAITQLHCHSLHPSHRKHPSPHTPLTPIAPLLHHTPLTPPPPHPCSVSPSFAPPAATTSTAAPC